MSNTPDEETSSGFAADAVFRRLRWIMACAILFSIFNTLAGQPTGFWSNPELAMRGDGLGLHNPVNHTFEFFLGHGWIPYLLANAAYLALALILVSILPRKTALIAVFAFIFGHFYVASSWLAVRWHLGFNGVAGYALALSAAIAWAASPVPGPAADNIIRRLRWVMLGVMLLDPTLTLIGQPGSYWAHPETVLEGNPFWRSFMVQGWWAYIAMDLLYCLGAFWLASSLPRFYAALTIFAFTLSHFIGGSSWFFYVWRLGMQWPVTYGIAIGASIVLIAFRRFENTTAAGENLSGRAPANRACCC